MKLDDLHYGYQANASTSMCTWTITSIVEHYNGQGNTVYGCGADMSKAFDMVSWKPLFIELMSRGISYIFLRILLFIYTKQTCDVRWNN